jgi:hypothetical protein
MGVRDNSFVEFIGSRAYEDDGGWSKEVWDAAWQARQQEIDVLQARIKLLESEVAWAENGYTQPKE